jgi:hypothetical protein
MGQTPGGLRRRVMTLKSIGALLLLALAGPLRADAVQDPPAFEPMRASASLFSGKTDDPRVLALRAYVWGYPLVRAAQIRQNMTSPEDPFVTRPASVAGAPINRFGHARELATPATRQGVAPNNDTLYSVAWLDMTQGPFVLDTPEFGSRYYTFQMGQADTSTDVALGQRNCGGKLPLVFIYGTGRQQRVPHGMWGVHASQRYLMIAGRVLVRDRDDLPVVHQLQERIKLWRWVDYQAGRDVRPPVSQQRALIARDAALPDDLSFFEMLGNVLRDWRVQPKERELVRSFEQIGLSLAGGFQPDKLPPEARTSISRGIADGQALVRQMTFKLGTNVNGWAINYGGSVFHDDYLLRAAVAMDQIYVLPAAEALYPNARVDGTGRELDGHNSYILHFSGDSLPPVASFWSVTLYFAKGLMAANEIDRYSIGDRTPGLRVAADGSVDILIQHQRPPELAAVNWLPAPEEPFMLMLRLYQPKAPVLSGEWVPPPVEKVELRQSVRVGRD